LQKGPLRGTFRELGQGAAADARPAARRGLAGGGPGKRSDPRRLTAGGFWNEMPRSCGFVSLARRSDAGRVLLLFFLARYRFPFSSDGTIIPAGRESLALFQIPLTSLITPCAALITRSHRPAIKGNRMIWTAIRSIRLLQPLPLPARQAKAFTARSARLFICFPFLPYYSTKIRQNISGLLEIVSKNHRLFLSI
jgi:hypothetical protein